jgi:hypothetical protein
LQCLEEDKILVFSQPAQGIISAGAGGVSSYLMLTMRLRESRKIVTYATYIYSAVTKVRDDRI